MLAITFHEAAHGLVAYWLGDRTAHDQGRLTINPIAHIDPIGLLCILIAGFGWAKPVPVDPRNFKRPKIGMALTALAGPVCNLLLSFLLCLVAIPLYFNFTGVWAALGKFLWITASINAGFAIFNLLPVPPLDGSKLLIPFLSNRALHLFFRWETYIRFALMACIFLGLLDGVIGTAQSYVFGNLFAGAIRILSAIGVLA